MELADKNTSELQAAALMTAINAVQNPTGEKAKKQSGQACYRIDDSHQCCAKPTKEKAKKRSGQPCYCCGGPHSPVLSQKNVANGKNMDTSQKCAHTMQGGW